jgi:hypothetical protein
MFTKIYNLLCLAYSSTTQLLGPVLTVSPTNLLLCSPKLGTVQVAFKKAQ